MSTIYSAGYFINHHSALVRHDSGLSHSLLSLDFALWILGIRPDRNSELQVTVDIATDQSGITFSYSFFSFAVRSNLDVDVVFGRDWIGLCRTLCDDGVVVFSKDVWEGNLFGNASDVSRAAAEESVQDVDMILETETLSFDRRPTLPPCTCYVASAGPSQCRRCMASVVAQCSSPVSVETVSTEQSSVCNVASESTSAFYADNRDRRAWLDTVLLSHSRSPLFSNWPDLCALSTSHGLESPESHTVRELRVRLIRHLLSGDCFLFHLHPRDEADPSFKRSCQEVVALFPSPEAFVSEIFDVLLEKDSSLLPTDKLLLVLETVSPKHVSLSIPSLRLDTKRALRCSLPLCLRGISHVPDLSVAKRSMLDTTSLQRLMLDVSSKSKTDLTRLAELHGLDLSHKHRTDLERLILSHLSKGRCVKRLIADEDAPALHVTTPTEVEMVPSGCADIRASLNCDHQTVSLPSCSELQLSVLSSFLRKDVNATPKVLRYILKAHQIPFKPGDSRGELRSHLKSYLSVAKKGKRKEQRAVRGWQERERPDIKKAGDLRAKACDARMSWPQLVPARRKEDLLRTFKHLTSSASLKSTTCAVCAEEKLVSECTRAGLDSVDWNILKRPDRRLLIPDDPSSVDDTWLDVDYTQPPIDSWPELRDVLLDPRGVERDTAGKLSVTICCSCSSPLSRGKTPPLSIANHNYLGPVPPELQDLTVVEEAFISLCRAKCWILKLCGKGLDDDDFQNHDQEEADANLSRRENVTRERGSYADQRGFKGHIITYPQMPSEIVSELPPPMEEMCTYICAIFVGPKPPTKQWLREKARPLYVRKEKVQRALLWLKTHNPLYRDVRINETNLQALPQHDILPVHVQHVLPEEAGEELTSRYDLSLADFATEAEHPLPEPTVPYEKVVISCAGGKASAEELRRAASRHIKGRAGTAIVVPHDSSASIEFNNPKLFPLLYPTLFPYGMGGCEDSRRCARISLKRHLRHFFSLGDRRFQEHYSFLFVAFNMLQRRQILLHTYLKTKRSGFDRLAEEFASVDPAAAISIRDRLASGLPLKPMDVNESKVLKLLQHINVVTGHVPGSNAARLKMRNEIRGLMMDKGLPSFYITINPADVYNPLVKFLAGSEIDIDNLLPEQIPVYREMELLVAKNPFVASKFFNIYLKAFMKAIIGFDPDKKMDSVGDDGILGLVRAHYGCVEAQGRGSLHCHMLVWVEGALNPDEIKRKILEDGDKEFERRLIAYLDDIISTSIPEDPAPDPIPMRYPFPSSVRGPGTNLASHRYAIEKERDFHRLVKKCQSHEHRDTCFKYCKGSGPKECRFDLRKSRAQPTTSFDRETGELTVRHIDGLVNGYNDTMISAVRCNMDIKFIGSGVSAKSIMYYVTDYITKTQLKNHVAYATIATVMDRLQRVDAQSQSESSESSAELRGHDLLRKCSYAMIQHQELSAQQVASYLMDYEDHFTSHEFSQVFWSDFERHVMKETVNSDELEPMALSTERSIPDESSAGFDENRYVMNSPGHLRDNVLDQSSVQCLDDDEEIQVEFDCEGQLVAKSGPVADYLFRGYELNGINLWEFAARTEKIWKKASVNSDMVDSDSEDEDTENDESELSTGFEGAQTEPSTLDDCGVTVLDKLLIDTGKKRPRVDFLADHKEVGTRTLKIRHPLKRRIPVPIGSGIPRRDREDQYERYCRAMLILFKPWRSRSDLCNAGQSWSESFAEFCELCSAQVLSVMDNMQLLHECKDSRDDHFARRRSRARVHNDDDNPYAVRTGETAEVTFHEEQDEDEVLRNVALMDQARSVQRKKARHNVNRCLAEARKSGMFSSTMDKNEACSRYRVNGSMECVRVDDTAFEQECRKYYESSRAVFRRNVARAKVPGPDDGLAASEAFQHGYSRMVTVNDAGSIEVTAGSQIPLVPVMRIVNDSVEGDPEVSIEDVISEYTLNEEQARAFRIVAQHSMQPSAEPLRMFLGGPGGTGKSRVISALKEFFDRRNQSRRFRLASFTGVAAKNIAGMTLHASLLLNQSRSSVIGQKTRRDLTAMWDGVDYLFIDEVSMVSCRLLMKVSEALAVAKQHEANFGGINVIFAGDFAQLRPVCETRLFAHLKRVRKATVSGQDDIHGKLLWLSVDTVVILHENKRQQGNKNKAFVELLQRLRFGACTHEDYELLNTRLISRADPDWSSKEWGMAPLIVSENAIKDKFNEEAAAKFARDTGREMHHYYAKDTWNGKPILLDELKEHLLELDSGKTSQRLGKIPLVLGMPVIIAYNFDVGNGVVNGSQGVLKKIRYTVDADGTRYLQSCIVECDDVPVTMPSLAGNEVMVIQDSVKFRLQDSIVKGKNTFMRTQVPIFPAWSITAHKAQGQTLKNAVVDIHSGMSRPRSPLCYGVSSYVSGGAAYITAL